MPSSGTSSPSPYQMVGAYRIVAHIATGGMAAVYQAQHPQTNQIVALKLLAPEVIAAQPKLLERFRREARHGSKLQHENIVSLYEFGEADGAYFLVMEFVNGIDLHERIREGPLDPEQARRMLLQIARALEHAHEHGIVHRDVKPSNILLTQSKGQTLAKLADFGLARTARQDEFRVTRDGHTVGTIDYISPEQAKDSSAADIRSDIYSLGCTFYHALAGVLPFEGTLAERIHKRLTRPPVSVRRHNPLVPPELAVVLQRMLAPRPQDRFQSPTELIAALEADAPSVDTVETAVQASDAASMLTGSQRIAMGRYQYASQLLAAREFSRGITVLQECCRFDPFNLHYRRKLRHVQRSLRDSAPGKWFAWLAALPALRRFHTARLAGDHLKVLDQGEQVLTHKPWDVSVQINMANAAEALGQTELALWILRHAQRKGSVNIAVKRCVALIHENEGNLVDAIAAWESVQRADPTNGEASAKIRDLSARETLLRTTGAGPAMDDFAEE